MAETDRTIPFYQTVEGCIIPGGFSVDAFKSALKYVPRDDDLFIVTYPKCGTTWTQQICYLIFNKGVPGGNFQEFVQRNPFLELLGIESGEAMPRPGAIKVHLPFRLTPYSEKAKYLYVVRNPKDVVVSYYQHAITDPSFVFQEGKFDRFFEDFISGETVFNDYFDHVLDWYEHANDSNVLFITYEEMKEDTKKTVLKIAKFMGDKWYDMLLNDEEILANVLKYSSLEHMRKQLNTDFIDVMPGEQDKQKLFPGLKHYMEFSQKHSQEGDEQFHLIRTGKLGRWREVLSEDQVARLDEKIEKRLKGTSLYTYWKSINCI